MNNYGLPKYDKYRNWIKQARENKVDWDKINFANTDSEIKLERFLEDQRKTNWWEINSVQWKEIVALEKEAEEQTKDISYIDGQAMILDEGQDNAVYVPDTGKSAWVLYKKHLLSQGFKPYVVQNMQNTTLKILKRLSSNTVESGPIKGLVIGNVQSGKTANMAALMAMAADWGWNLFIVLSGTIENLRQQTQKRLLNDLNCPGNLCWRGLEHLSKKPSYGQRTQDLHFEEDSPERYINVCLKNSGRLKKLIEWLQTDSNKQKQMKILVIDDEADQAGINTADISSKERRTINKLIVNMVSGRNKEGSEIDTKYRAMNYIGYTATPYANILNECGDESLYPRNFISTLGVSKEYFGPQQIFGVDNGEYDGMDIVRIINNYNDKDSEQKEENRNDLKHIKEIHDGLITGIPKSLQDAVCWFLCGAASMRLWNYKKPISMLVHTSQKQDHHQYIADAIQRWLQQNDVDSICRKCEEVWNDETSRFTLEKFRNQYIDYDRKDEEINIYPQFDEVGKEIRLLLSCITNIPLGDNEEFEYHKGIHMCIDNCSKNGVNEDGMYVRLAYPDFKNVPSPAPVFIVIGGATLSRGLTIEGLISTYFLRSVGQADTLMQMGRWFGYRKGYELLPRLWITSKTNKQFEFLSSLDEELRNEIHYMDTMALSPIKYGPKIKNTPKYSLIKITAKNRMQSAEPAKMDFTGAFNQTYLFYNDSKILKNNIDIVENFIMKLGKPETRKKYNEHAANSIIWRNVKFEKIHNMLEQYKFCKRLKAFNDIKSMAEWINKVTDSGKLTDWNVVVSGKTNDNNKVWNLPIGKINKVKRTRKKGEKDPNIINIGALRDPRDIVADVDLEGKDASIKEKINNFKSKYAKEIRNLAGLDMTPQLLIYRVDKDSEATPLNDREDLNSQEDIVGLCINIPGGRRGTDYVESISIHLDNDSLEDDVFDDDGDLEGTNEN